MEGTCYILEYKFTGTTYGGHARTPPCTSPPERLPWCVKYLLRLLTSEKETSPLPKLGEVKTRELNELSHPSQASSKMRMFGPPPALVARAARVHHRASTQLSLIKGKRRWLYTYTRVPISRALQ